MGDDHVCAFRNINRTQSSIQLEEKGCYSNLFDRSNSLVVVVIDGPMEMFRPCIYTPKALQQITLSCICIRCVFQSSIITNLTSLGLIDTSTLDHLSFLIPRFFPFLVFYKMTFSIHIDEISFLRTVKTYKRKLHIGFQRILMWNHRNYQKVLIYKVTLSQEGDCFNVIGSRARSRRHAAFQ